MAVLANTTCTVAELVNKWLFQVLCVCMCKLMVYKKHVWLIIS